VFVYGTLKRGISNHRLLADSEYICNAYTVDTFKMYTVGFPIIMPADGPDAWAVYGEVYDVDDATLKRLDGLEAEGIMYDRKLINVCLEQPMGRQELIDANVSVYIGNPKYWAGLKPSQGYHDLNIHDELEWRP
jgi:gamma-glutamylcyclotransferase (GGCT)/AIG2-like uncharacterized protein YtfP